MPILLQPYWDPILSISSRASIEGLYQLVGVTDVCSKYIVSIAFLQSSHMCLPWDK